MKLLNKDACKWIEINHSINSIRKWYFIKQNYYKTLINIKLNVFNLILHISIRSFRTWDELFGWRHKDVTSSLCPCISNSSSAVAVLYTRMPFAVHTSNWRPSQDNKCCRRVSCPPPVRTIFKFSNFTACFKNNFALWTPAAALRRAFLLPVSLWPQPQNRQNYAARVGDSTVKTTFCPLSPRQFSALPRTNLEARPACCFLLILVLSSSPLPQPKNISKIFVRGQQDHEPEVLN